MNPRPPPRGRGGSPFTLALFVAATTAFGFVGGLADLVGPVIGAAGVVATAILRRRYPDTGPALMLLPALAALGVLAVTAAPVPSTELLGGVASLTLLLWTADDPARPAGGGRRAVPALAACAASVGIVFGLSLALPSLPPGIGIAGGLLALVILVLAVLLERISLAPSERGASA